MQSLKFIYKNLDQFKPQFLVIFLTGILDGLATFFIPVVLAEFTKSSFLPSDFMDLIRLVIIFYITSLVLQWIIRKWGEALCHQFGNHIRLKYFSALEKLPLSTLIEFHSGYILSLVNRISDGLAPVMFEIFWTFAKSIANITLFFYFTAKESAIIAIINLLILLIFIAISTYLSNKMVPIADKLNKKHASLMESYTDFMSNIMTIKRLSIHEFAENILTHKTSENFKQIQILQNFHANRWFFLHTLFGFAFLSTIGFLLLQVSQSKLSASILILFVAAYSTVKGNMERLSESFKTLMEMKAYINALDEIIIPTSPVISGKVIGEWHKIKFENIQFQYPGTEKNIKIPNFSLKKGEKICIIGKSGEGKTTLLNLVINFLNPLVGTRLIDNEQYENISKKIFQNNMTVISQETELFNISLRENITLGKKIEEKKLLDILKKLDLLHWVQSLENGLDTIVGEKGVKLSSGQKQRVNLIRGLLLNRDILLLDEPTSHLDQSTEAKVLEFLSEYLSTKTAVIVSHHPELSRICTRTYQFQNHTLEEI